MKVVKKKKKEHENMGKRMENGLSGDPKGTNIGRKHMNKEYKLVWIYCINISKVIYKWNFIKIYTRYYNFTYNQLH